MVGSNALVSVIALLLGSEAQSWPPLFGDVRDAWSIRQFWGYVLTFLPLSTNCFGILKVEADADDCQWQIVLAQYTQSDFHRPRRLNHQHDSSNPSEKCIEQSYDDDYHFLSFSWDACFEYHFQRQELYHMACCLLVLLDGCRDGF